MTGENPPNESPEPPADASAEAEATGRGFRADEGDPSGLLEAVRASIGYRGDVTISRKSSSEPVIGYAYDLKRADDPAEALIRLLPADGGGSMTVPVSDLSSIEFSGKDAAAGRSFDTWVEEYARKKIAAESSEPS